MAINKTSRVSATGARVHFGEMMRRAEGGETLVAERAGEPKAVIISFEAFSELNQGSITTDPLEERLRKMRERYLREAADVHYDVEGEIRKMREERADEIDSGLR